jgi:PST family polysaccharide transporter
VTDTDLTPDEGPERPITDRSLDPAGSDPGLEPLEPTAIEPVGRRAGRGMLWMVGGTAVTKAGSLITQVVLGWILSDGDFGVYAIAVSVALIAQVLRDGGIRVLLVQEGDPAFERQVRPAFWMSLVFSLFCAAGLVAVAPALAGVFGEPELVPVLLVLALSLPVQSMVVPAVARLQIDLRFRTLARIELVSSIIRYGLTIVLALAGLGPLAFAIPIVAAAAYEALAGWLATRVTAWRRPVELDRWRSLFRRSKWVMLNTLATAVPRQSDYFALGLSAPIDVVGVYFFAYQLTFQFASLLQTNIRKVLLASFASRHTDRDWLERSLLRACEALALVSSLALVSLIALAGDLEALVWRGRWSDAVPAIAVFAALLPPALVLLVPDYALQATGRFRLSFVTSLAGNLGIPVVAYLAGPLATSTAETWKLAVVVGGWTVASSAFQSIVALRVLGISVLHFAVRTAPPFALGLLLAVLVRLVPCDLPPLFCLVVRAALYVVPYLLLARLLLPGQMSAAISVADGLPPARLARRLVRLPAPTDP